MLAHRGALSALAASLCFGVATAVVGTVKRPDLVGILLLGAVVSLTVIAKPSAVVNTLRKHPRTFAAIGVLETLNFATFYGALAVGPVPVVTAVHLSAPLILLALGVLRRTRALSWWVALEFGVVALALSIGAARPDGGFSQGAVLQGCALALLSAAAVCGMFMVISASGITSGSATSAAAQLSVAFLLLSPVMLLSTGFDMPTASVLFVTGAIPLAAGLLFTWMALRHSSPSTVSVIMLNEAVTATIIVAVVSHTVSWHATVSGALMLVAVGAELWHGRSPQSSKAPTHASRDTSPDG